MSGSSDPPSDPGAAGDADFRAALAAIAARTQIAQRLELGSTEAILRSVVDAAVALFEAEAASLALFDASRNVLVFRVAAGEHGQGVVGIEIQPNQGLAGYVFSSGQAIAVADISTDDRFGRGVADSTGYVPRSIVAVPLLDAEGTLGVLEVLDKRRESAFSLRDVELAGVFAHQATVAIRGSRVEQDTALLVGTVVRRLAGVGVPSEGVDAVVGAALDGLCGEDDPFWPLVELIATIRRASPEQLDLVTALLEALAGHLSTRRGSRFRAGRIGGGRLGTARYADTSGSGPVGEPQVDE